MRKIVRNKSGQSLIEYLLLVAVMGVASIGVIRLLNHTVNAKFSQVVDALNNKNTAISTEQVDRSYYQKRNLGDFFEKAAD